MQKPLFFLLKLFENIIFRFSIKNWSWKKSEIDINSKSFVMVALPLQYWEVDLANLSTFSREVREPNFFFRLNPHTSPQKSTHRFSFHLFSLRKKIRFTDGVGSRGGHFDVTHVFFIQIEWKFVFNDKTQYQIGWAWSEGVCSVNDVEGVFGKPFF